MVAANESYLNGDSSLFHFHNQEDFGEVYIVNDSVMGGRSVSSVYLTSVTIFPESSVSLRQEEVDGEEVVGVEFRGNVSLENNGGFASVRFRNMRSFPKDAIVSLKALGDGKAYQLRFRMNGQRWSYSANFDTKEGELMTFQFKESDFKPTFRGRTVRGAGPLQLEYVTEVTVMVADKQRGEFKLFLSELDFITNTI